MTNINKDKMLQIADKVLSEFKENVDEDVLNNPYFNNLVGAIADIAALTVLEYHKAINKEED